MNPLPMWVFDPDTLAFLAVNQAAIAKYGYAREEFLGMTLNDIRPPEDIPALLRELSIRSEDLREAGQWRHRKKDGTLIDVEIRRHDLKWQGRDATLVVANDITERKRSVDALRESERRFKDLFENALLGLYRTTPDGEINMANPALCRMLGYNSLEELQQRNLEKEGFHPTYSRMDFKKILEEKGSIVGLESAWKRGDGSVIFVRESATTIRDDSGKVLFYEGTVEDITERKKAMDALQAERRVWRALLDNLPDYIYAKDTNNRFLLANEALARRMGAASSDELLGKSDFDFYPPDLAAKYAHDERQVMRSGQPVIDREESTIDTSNGQTVWHTTSEVPFRDEKGNVLGLVGIGHNITERKQNEAQLRLQAAALESAANAVVITDRSDKIMWVNPAFTVVTGYSSEEAIGQSLTILNSDKHPKSFFDEISKTIRAGKVWHGEVVNRRKDGNLFTDEQTITPVRNESGEITRFVTIEQDVTEKKQLAQQLNHAQRMESVGRLAGGVAHDFNNLLTVIIHYSAALMERKELDPHARQQAEEIKKAGNRAAALTRQLLAFSRQQVLEQKILNLNAIVTDTEKMLRRLIGEDIELLTGLNPNLSSVKADPGQIEQIIMNLAVNARDAMPKGGKLTIETANTDLDEEYARHHPSSAPGRFVLLSVTDTGIGMDQETRTHIFEPFFTTKELGKGTGLGLSTVYGIVKQSGGYIWVYSEPGQGSVFKVYLPRVEEPAQQIHRSEPAAETPGGTETVLVVEDDESLRTLTRIILEEAGYTVLEANSGPQAIETAQRRSAPIHLLLTDVVMPGMNGPKVAEELAQRHPEAKVLYMSGYTGFTAADRGLLDAKVSLIQKPFSADSLLRKVREVLEARTETKPS